MLRSLLIANRGEIARRVIRTARRLGIRTIAVYSEADAEAPHRREADAAVAIGPGPARQSYLDAGKILAAARETGAEAVHPGYGFLSENADFAEAVIKAGLIWVGPKPAAILAMGLKDAAKRLMAEAGVPVTPGYFGADQSETRLEQEAAAIGYPVLIKAVAGGGGKGMRRVEGAAQFRDALAGAKREALAAFGDDRVLLETYVARPRHIEVQIFGDSHGNIVHLFERDCSVQRRHQKVLEEAPAPGMDAATRKALTEAAVRAAAAVRYEGAGTVEFIADASDGLRPYRVWFMEMNTRLQVEHPVTEAITGQDLVEWQLRVAWGEALPLRQEELAISGHAIEARLYAENPAKNFLPSTGRFAHLRLPEGEIRIDSGIEAGSQMTPFYDPMIAKLIAHAPDRRAAIGKLAAACRNVEIWPVKSNAGFLARCLADADFASGRVDTHFIDGKRQTLLRAEPPAGLAEAAAAARLREGIAGWDAADAPWPALAGFRLNAPPAIEIALEGEAGPQRIALGGVDAKPRFATAIVEGTTLVFAAGEVYAFRPPEMTRARAGAAAEENAVFAPMPGRIVAVRAEAGAKVAKGEIVLVLEAMKMEYALTAPKDGKVAELTVKAGDLVQEGAALLRLE
jgi:acetyl/propionyl-CoA carboxylase alpha subunit